MKTKKCSRCKEIKSSEEFNKNSSRPCGLTSACIPCRKKRRAKNKEKIRKRNKRYYRKNKDKIRKQQKGYYESNKDYFLKKRKNHYEENRESKKEYQRKYREDNWDTILKKNIEYRMERYHKDPQFRINMNFSRVIRLSISDKSGNNWEDLVGYTLKDLKKRLEWQFTEKMNWDNYGDYWHIDHKKPKSWFDFDSYEDPEFKDCWCLANLQPLPAKENLSKNNRYSG